MLARVLLFLALVSPLVAAPEYPKMGPDIYDPKADGEQQIAAALQKAKAGHKNVLLMFGANWCIWCHRLHTTFETNPQVAPVLRADYELVLIDVNTRHGVARNAAVDARYGHPIQFGLPVLVVLDANGRPLTTEDSGKLEDGKSGHDPAKVVAFLREWQPNRVRTTNGHE